MPNDYYNNQHTLNKHELAKGSDVENKLDGVEAGFDKLPSPDDFATVLTPYVTTIFTNNEYAVTLPDVIAYTDGMTVNAKLDASNTAAVTLNVNGLGGVAVLRPNFEPLRAGDLITNSILECRYNGEAFIITSGTPGIVTEAETAAAIAVDSKTISEKASWNSLAAQYTTDSWASEPIDQPVQIYTSNDDGTFSNTNALPSPQYSALHWQSKSQYNGDNVSKQEPLLQTMIGELELPDAILSAIDVLINTNAVVDVFIYDTSLDDDGGAWVDKANWQSWYNEPLNTATRGKTKAFPKLAIVVAESDKVTIYDGLDGSMWMVFDKGSNYHIGGESNNTTINMLNGTMYLTVSNGLFTEDFINDVSYHNRLSNGSTRNLPVVGRNSANTSMIDSSKGIASDICNDVAVTSDGNMGNIVAVATDSGVSVIHPDGSVADNTAVVSFNNEANVIQFRDNNRLEWFTRHGGVYLVNTAIPTSDVSTIQSDDIVYWTNSTSFSSGIDRRIRNFSNHTCISKNASGGNGGIHLIKDFDIDAYMNAEVSSEYNTGYMFGDIKGAFLANSKTADRSINNKPLTEVGTITEAPVAAGAELMGYSGFSTGDYVEQAYNADLDFGTDDFYIMGWVKKDTNLDYAAFIERDSDPEDNNSQLKMDIGASGLWRMNIGGSALTSTISMAESIWTFLVGVRVSGVTNLYTNAVLSASGANTVNVINTQAKLHFGVNRLNTASFTGSLSLFSIGKGAPTAQQIKEIYDAEFPLFQPNTKCTLQGTSSDVKALDYDESTGLLTVCSADHTTKLNGLVVVSDEAVVSTSISTVSGKTVRGT